ncbi:hypothetical protein [Methylomonas methanica]|uniref:Uncharacterized protein n=1 Tax=Methylomonas methanica (strain DSM 25384 / MC09) TaxID=857087 RepID=G0A424_METMM|nr:hypothetical protein [Methylomonas methanica]AEF99071.1 hypothetical protein Metme_0627 [Methylomonas methanica MC09]
MKLMLQIAFGVFLGTLGAQIVVDVWHTRQEQRAKQIAEQRIAEQEKVRREQGERIRLLLLKGHQADEAGGSTQAIESMPDKAQGQ